MMPGMPVTTQPGEPQVFQVSLKYMSVDDATKLFAKDGNIWQFVPKGIISIVGLKGAGKLLIKSTDPAAVIHFTQLLELLDRVIDRRDPARP